MSSEVLKPKPFLKKDGIPLSQLRLSEGALGRLDEYQVQAVYFTTDILLRSNVNATTATMATPSITWRA